MATTTTTTNKPLNPRAQDLSPKGYNRAALYSGKALDFDGVNDNIIVNGVDSVFDYGNAYTMAGYFKIVDGGSGSLMGNSNGNAFGNFLGFVYKSGDDSNFYPDGSSSNFVTIYSGNTTGFVYIVCTSDGTTAKAYLNGEFVGSTSVSSYTNTGSQFNVGSSYSGNFGEHEAAGVKIFNTALTAAQVADLYLNPEKIVPDGVASSALKLWLPMMEGAGTTAYDGSGNGNHGTISGATWVSGIGAPVAQTALVSWNKGTNYIDKSEEFETASWSENQLVTITDDSFIAPDGSATATEIVETTANDSHFLSQTLSVTAGDYFISAYVKKRDYDWVQLSTGGDTSRYANFNISTGATGNASGITELIIEDAGNGWYRIGGKLTTSATSFNYFIALIQSDVASRFQTYTGTDKGQYIWGAQATKSTTLQPYLRNIGTSAITAEVLLPQGLTANKDITGVNAFESARNPYALNLDGASWAEVHDNASLDFGTGSFTLEAWARVKYVNQGSTLNAILSLGGNGSGAGSAALFVTSSNAPSFYYNGNSSNASPKTEGDWVHIVGVYDETNATIYINATQEDQDARTAGNITNALVKQIGRDTTSTRYYNDQIAQPRIYNRALTATEVLRNYNADKSKFGL
jgi:hypothetical protein